MPNINPQKLSDPIAEETLIGLLLTGREDVYSVVDVEATDFEDYYFRLIRYAVTPMLSREGDQPPQEIVDLLDTCALIDPAPFAVPLPWYVELMEKAIHRTNRAMDLHRLTLTEAVTWLSLRVKLAAANRYDNKFISDKTPRYYRTLKWEHQNGKTFDLCPIESVAKWAITGKGGHNLELPMFEEPDDYSDEPLTCAAKWGLCE